jgi:hypothetical protein
MNSTGWLSVAESLLNAADKAVVKTVNKVAGAGASAGGVLRNLDSSVWVRALPKHRCPAEHVQMVQENPTQRVHWIRGHVQRGR